MSGLNKLVLLSLLLFAACSSGPLPRVADLAAPAGDLSAPIDFAGFLPIPCASTTCLAGQVCVRFIVPGQSLGEMGVGSTDYCADIPPSCSGTTPSCGALLGEPGTGCLNDLCQTEPDCTFDGQLVVCDVL